MEVRIFRPSVVTSPEPGALRSLRKLVSLLHERTFTAILLHPYTTITPTLFTHPSLVSRRQSFRSSLSACGYAAAGSLVLAQPRDHTRPNGYTPSGPVTDRGRAPGLRARVVAETRSGEKTYAVIFAKGDEVLSGLTEFAERENLAAEHFTAIGALQSARFGWFDAARKAYRDIPIDHQAELGGPGAGGR